MPRILLALTALQTLFFFSEVDSRRVQGIPPGYSQEFTSLDNQPRKSESERTSWSAEENNTISKEAEHFQSFLNGKQNGNQTLDSWDFSKLFKLVMSFVAKVEEENISLPSQLEEKLNIQRKISSADKNSIRQKNDFVNKQKYENSIDKKNNANKERKEKVENIVKFIQSKQKRSEEIKSFQIPDKERESSEYNEENVTSEEDSVEEECEFEYDSYESSIEEINLEESENKSDFKFDSKKASESKYESKMANKKTSKALTPEHLVSINKNFEDEFSKQKAAATDDYITPTSEKRRKENVAVTKALSEISMESNERVTHLFTVSSRNAFDVEKTSPPPLVYETIPYESPSTEIPNKHLLKTNTSKPKIPNAARHQKKSNVKNSETTQTAMTDKAVNGNIKQTTEMTSDNVEESREEHQEYNTFQKYTRSTPTPNVKNVANRKKSDKTKSETGMVNNSADENGDSQKSPKNLKYDRFKASQEESVEHPTEQVNNEIAQIFQKEIRNHKKSTEKSSIREQISETDKTNRRNIDHSKQINRNESAAQKESEIEKHKYTTPQINLQSTSVSVPQTSQNKAKKNKALDEKSSKSMLGETADTDDANNISEKPSVTNGSKKYHGTTKPNEIQTISTSKPQIFQNRAHVDEKSDEKDSKMQRTSSTDKTSNENFEDSKQTEKVASDITDQSQEEYSEYTGMQTNKKISAHERQASQGKLQNHRKLIENSSERRRTKSSDRTTQNGNDDSVQTSNNEKASERRQTDSSTRTTHDVNDDSVQTDNNEKYSERWQTDSAARTTHNINDDSMKANNDEESSERQRTDLSDRTTHDVNDDSTQRNKNESESSLGKYEVKKPEFTTSQSSFQNTSTSKPKIFKNGMNEYKKLSKDSSKRNQTKKSNKMIKNNNKDSKQLNENASVASQETPEQSKYMTQGIQIQETSTPKAQHHRKSKKSHQRKNSRKNNFKKTPVWMMNDDDSKSTTLKTDTSFMFEESHIENTKYSTSQENIQSTPHRTTIYDNDWEQENENKSHTTTAKLQDKHEASLPISHDTHTSEPLISQIKTLYPNKESKKNSTELEKMMTTDNINDDNENMKEQKENTSKEFGETLIENLEMTTTPASIQTAFETKFLTYNNDDDWESQNKSAPNQTEQSQDDKKDKMSQFKDKISSQGTEMTNFHSFRNTIENLKMENSTFTEAEQIKTDASDDDDATQPNENKSEKHEESQENPRMTRVNAQSNSQSTFSIYDNIDEWKQPNKNLPHSIENLPEEKRKSTTLQIIVSDTPTQNPWGTQGVIKYHEDTPEESGMTEEEIFNSDKNQPYENTMTPINIQTTSKLDIPSDNYKDWKQLSSHATEELKEGKKKKITSQRSVESTLTTSTEVSQNETKIREESDEKVTALKQMPANKESSNDARHIYLSNKATSEESRKENVESTTPKENIQSTSKYNPSTNDDFDSKQPVKSPSHTNEKLGEKSTTHQIYPISTPTPPISRSEKKDLVESEGKTIMLKGMVVNEETISGNTDINQSNESEPDMPKESNNENPENTTMQVNNQSTSEPELSTNDNFDDLEESDQNELHTILNSQEKKEKSTVQISVQSTVIPNLQISQIGIKNSNKSEEENIKMEHTETSEKNENDDVDMKERKKEIMSNMSDESRKEKLKYSMSKINMQSTNKYEDRKIEDNIYNWKQSFKSISEVSKETSSASNNEFVNMPKFKENEPEYNPGITESKHLLESTPIPIISYEKFSSYPTNEKEITFSKSTGEYIPRQFFMQKLSHSQNGDNSGKMNVIASVINEPLTEAHKNIENTTDSDTHISKEKGNANNNKETHAQSNQNLENDNKSSVENFTEQKHSTPKLTSLYSDVVYSTTNIPQYTTIAGNTNIYNEKEVKEITSLSNEVVFITTIAPAVKGRSTSIAPATLSVTDKLTSKQQHKSTMKEKTSVMDRYTTYDDQEDTSFNLLKHKTTTELYQLTTAVPINSASKAMTSKTNENSRSHSEFRSLDTFFDGELTNKFHETRISEYDEVSVETRDEIEPDSGDSEESESFESEENSEEYSSEENESVEETETSMLDLALMNSTMETASDFVAEDIKETDENEMMTTETQDKVSDFSVSYPTMKYFIMTTPQDEKETENNKEKNDGVSKSEMIYNFSYVTTEAPVIIAPKEEEETDESKKMTSGRSTEDSYSTTKSQNLATSIEEKEDKKNTQQFSNTKLNNNFFDLTTESPTNAVTENESTLVYGKENIDKKQTSHYSSGMFNSKTKTAISSADEQVKESGETIAPQKSRMDTLDSTTESPVTVTTEEKYQKESSEENSYEAQKSQMDYTLFGLESEVSNFAVINKIHKDDNTKEKNFDQFKLESIRKSSLNPAFEEEKVNKIGKKNILETRISKTNFNLNDSYSKEQLENMTEPEDTIKVANKEKTHESEISEIHSTLFDSNSSKKPFNDSDIVKNTQESNNENKGSKTQKFTNDIPISNSDSTNKELTITTTEKENETADNEEKDLHIQKSDVDTTLFNTISLKKTFNKADVVKETPKESINGKKTSKTQKSIKDFFISNSDLTKKESSIVQMEEKNEATDNEESDLETQMSAEDSTLFNTNSSKKTFNDVDIVKETQESNNEMKAFNTQKSRESYASKPDSIKKESGIALIKEENGDADNEESDLETQKSAEDSTLFNTNSSRKIFNNDDIVKETQEFNNEKEASETQKFKLESTTSKLSSTKKESDIALIKEENGDADNEEGGLETEKSAADATLLVSAMRAPNTTAVDTEKKQVNNDENTYDTFLEFLYSHSNNSFFKELQEE